MKLLRSKACFASFCCLVALAKLGLQANHEIVSIQDDSAVYASQSFGLWTLGYPPGYPLWLRFCGLFNVPQRLAIDALYLLAAMTVGYTLRKCFGQIPGYLAVGLLSFAPSTFYLFDLGLTDGFFTSLSLFALTIGILLLVAKVRRETITLAFGLGVVLGMMAITRNEDPLFALWIFLLAIAQASLGSGRSNPLFHWRSWQTASLISMVTLASAGMVICALCFSYYLAQGVFARGIALIPGHQEFLANLARIDTGEPQQRFVPISRRSRELAYGVSPTFAKLRPSIENPQDSWQITSRMFGIPNGEIGGGWIWHAINLKVLDREGGRPALAVVFYKRMNSEIEAAFKSGKLKRRFILHPLLGGDLTGLFRALPWSLDAVTVAAFSAQPDTGRDQGYNPALFDRAFSRRMALVSHGSEVTLQGWAFPDKSERKILSIQVSSNVVTSAPIVSQDRPDVVRVFAAQNGWKPNVVGFRTTLLGHSPDEVNVTYILDDGSQIEAHHLRTMRVTTLRGGPLAKVGVVQGIDVDEIPEQPHDARRDLDGVLYTELQSLRVREVGIAVVGIGFTLGCVALIWRRNRHFERHVVFLGFASLVWLTRILFYSLIDARAWPGNQIRYLAPANVLGVVMFSVSVSVLVKLLAQRGFGKQQLKPLARASEPFRTISHI